MGRTTMRSGRASPSRFYAVRSDLPEPATVAYAAHLDTMFVEYEKRLGSLERRAPHVLNVFMFARRQDYLETLRVEFGVDGAGSAGMFFVSPRGAGLAFCVEGVPRRGIQHLIQHEGFHQAAFVRFERDLPIWANEGMAEFFGEAVVVGNQVVIGQSTPSTIDRLRRAIEENATVPFLEMLTLTPQAWNARVQTGNAALQYQQAWSMVHFLVYGDRGRYRSAFEHYLRLLNTGMESSAAFGRAFGSTQLGDFEARWKAYASQATPGAFATAMERIEFLAEGMLALRGAGAPPATLDELREALRAANFERTDDRHGYRVRLAASDEGIFAIPRDEHCREEPVFVIEPFRPGRAPLRERRLEETNPTPPTIATRGLRPRELVVRWVRNEANDGFTYEIDLR